MSAETAVRYELPYVDEVVARVGTGGKEKGGTEMVAVLCYALSFESVVWYRYHVTL